MIEQVAAGETVTRPVQVLFGLRGPHGVAVNLPGDPLPSDDRHGAWSAITQSARLRMCEEVVGAPEWAVVNGERIRREFAFKKYLDGISWVPAIAAIAEQENHHPEIKILYRKVIIETWTHTVKGLSENDFILAAKLDASYRNFISSNC